MNEQLYGAGLTADEFYRKYWKVCMPIVDYPAKLHPFDTAGTMTETELKYLIGMHNSAKDSKFYAKVHRDKIYRKQ